MGYVLHSHETPYAIIATVVKIKKRKLSSKQKNKWRTNGEVIINEKIQKGEKQI